MDAQVVRVLGPVLAGLIATVVVFVVEVDYAPRPEPRVCEEHWVPRHEVWWERMRLDLEMAERVETLEKAVRDIDKKVEESIDLVVAAQTDADRASAKAKLERLRIEKVRLARASADARAYAALARRMQGFTVSHGCCKWHVKCG